MDSIPRPIGFEWDKGNADKNLKKHGVSTEETEEVFFDDLSVLSEDSKHSRTEKRYQIVGKSEKERLLSLIFTIRGDNIRVISARVANRKERRFYETGNKTLEANTTVSK